MSWREQLAKVDAVQKGRLFKVIASIVLAVAMIAAAITYVVVTNKPIDATEAMPAGLQQATAENQTTIDATKRIVEAVLAGRQDSTSVLVGMAVGLGLGLAVIWLGLGLTYLVLILCGLAPAVAIGLSLWGGANGAEIVRGGIQSVDTGQMEASRSLGLNWMQSMRKIVDDFIANPPVMGSPPIVLLATDGLPEPMQADVFRRRFGHVGSPAYQQVVDDIEQRIAALALFSPAP